MTNSRALAQWWLHMVLAPGSSIAAWLGIQKLRHRLSSRLPLKAFCGCWGNSLFRTFSIIESCVFVPDSTASTKHWLCRSKLVGRGRGQPLSECHCFLMKPIVLYARLYFYMVLPSCGPTYSSLTKFTDA